LLALLLLFACTDSDINRFVRDDTDSHDTDTDETDTDRPDTGVSWWETDPHNDADNDGYSLTEGDCNDLDPSVHPDATDTCDGVDTDCDGQVDNDVDGDQGEDTVLGNLTDTPEVFTYPMLFPQTDIDSFDFYVEDEVTGWFDIEVWLYQVPSDADYRLDLYWIEDANGTDRGHVLSSDDNGLGGFEYINHGGSTGRDDSGWYRITIQSNHGASCIAPYQRQFLIGGW